LTITIVSTVIREQRTSSSDNQTTHHKPGFLGVAKMAKTHFSLVWQGESFNFAQIHHRAPELTPDIKQNRRFYKQGHFAKCIKIENYPSDLLKGKT